MAFTHLHVHTEYSALDGMIRISDAFNVAASHGQHALAVTDHGTLGGMWAAQKAADKAGVKLIAGIEAYLANGSRHVKDAFSVPADDESADEDSERGEDDAKFALDTELGIKQRPYQHITLIATTPEGWRNLVTIQNKSHESVWRKPRVDYDLIAEHSAGIIILTGCLGGPVIGPLAHAKQFRDASANAEEAIRRLDAGETPSEDLEADLSAARHRVTEYTAHADRSERDVRGNLDRMIDAVGRDNVFVEIMDHGIPQESVILPDVVALAGEYGLPIVATNDAHHTHEKDQEAHSGWLLVQSKSTFANPTYQFHGDGFWLRTEDEMRAVRPEPWWQEACDNTQVVSDRIAGRVMPTSMDLLPKFPTPDGFADNRDYMFHLLRAGAQRIYGGISPTVRDRVLTEMEVIEESGYIDYFLVVHDLVSWCNNNGILTGPGRGSAAGAMVSYLMGITRVDPLRYNLLFERFLERGRTEPPDIDIDFPQARRGEVIEYLRERWGSDKVAFIGTFQMARSKAALTDAARVLDENIVGARLKSLLPMDGASPVSLAGILDENSEHAAAATKYRELVASSATAARIHEVASAFEDVIKGVGIHASGVIVSAEPLFDLVPMRWTVRGWALQWTGPEAEDVGLLKVDVLGLRNLDIVAKAVDYIAASTGVTIDPLAMPDPDRPDPDEVERVAAAFRVISEGRTAGLFQLESPKMTELAMEVSPHSLDDLSALVALFRPGPMGKGLHTEYARRKRDQSRISYRDYTTDPAEQRALETVLGDTFGTMIYQEQVMALGTVMAGFDAGMRSKLRKAVSKKKADLMAFVGEKFYEGGPREHRDDKGNVVSIPFSQTTMRTMWAAMLSFAQYAFNRCITGDTVVRRGDGSEATVAELHRRLYGAQSPQGTCPFCGDRPSRRTLESCEQCAMWMRKFRHPDRGITLLAYDEIDGRIRPQRVKDVHENGVKPVYRIELADGKSIRATGGHRFRTPDGYCTVDDLAPGDSLVTHVGYEPQVYTSAERTTSGERRSVPGNKPWLSGTRNTGYVDGGFVKLRQWTERTIETAACRECSRTRDDGRLERAHLDGNRLNNRPENLAWMCVSHHKAHDYAQNMRQRRWEKGHLAGASEIVTITPDGEEMTYDVEMGEGTDHNFIANGIVSHNSHSATYGYLSYTTAYLKGNWPAEYAAATLAVTDKPDKRTQVLRDLEREGITVLPPDVNAGNAETAAVNEATIRIGLAEARGVGAAGYAIAETRNASSIPFSSVSDVKQRVANPDTSRSALSSSVVTSLIESGAVDAFGPRLGQMVTGASPNSLKVPDMEWGILEKATRQRMNLLVPLGTHPLETLRGELEVDYPKLNARGKAEWFYADEIPDEDNAQVCVIGILASWAERSYSRGRMVNFRLEAPGGSVMATMWDEELTAITNEGKVPRVGDVVEARGRVQYRTIDAEPDDPEMMEQTIKELTVRVVRTLSIEDPRSGGAPLPVFERIDFALSDETDDSLDVQEPAPEPDATAEPAPEPAIDFAEPVFDEPTVRHVEQTALQLSAADDGREVVEVSYWDHVTTRLKDAIRRNRGVVRSDEYRIAKAAFEAGRVENREVVFTLLGTTFRYTASVKQALGDPDEIAEEERLRELVRNAA